VKISLKKDGYLIGVPLILMVIGMFIAIVLPMLPVIIGKALVIIVSLIAIAGLYYIL
jgi:hypothetical protein